MIFMVVLAGFQFGIYQKSIIGAGFIICLLLAIWSILNDVFGVYNR